MRGLLAFTLGLVLALGFSAHGQSQSGGGSSLPNGGSASNFLIGTPAWATTLPNPTAATTQAQGDASLDVTNNLFVAQAIAAVNPATAVNEATAAVLPNTPTYANGSSGVGATLTSSANAALTVDGIAVALNDRVLVKNQASAFQNGVYTETTLGNGSTAWVLTRATDYNAPSNIDYTGTINVLAGTANAGLNFLLQTPFPVVMGTDSLTYAQQSATPVNNGGKGCSAPLANGEVLIGLGGNKCGALGSYGTVPQALLSQGSNAAPVWGTPTPWSMPALANFTWVNQGTSTDGQNVTNGTIFITPQTTVAANWRLLTESTPASPWKLKVRLSVIDYAFYNSATVGIYVTDGTKMVGFELVTQAGGSFFRIESMNSPTSDNTTITTLTSTFSGAITQWRPFIWQIRYNGTTLFFDHCDDEGDNCFNVGSATAATYLGTITNFGIGALSANSGAVGEDAIFSNWYVGSNANLNGP